MTGSGTVEDPYIVVTVDDLQAIADDLTAVYWQDGDIDASATSGWNGGDGFTPLGNFTGTYDGKGYSITDFTINKAASSYRALFGTPNACTIKNVNITGSVTGNNYCGGLVGSIGGFVVSITDCTSSVTVSGAGLIGGLIGFESGGSTITKCSTSGSVTGTGNAVGG